MIVKIDELTMARMTIMRHFFNLRDNAHVLTTAITLLKVCSDASKSGSRIMLGDREIIL